MLRYVILEHHWYGIHYDLMLEHQHVLQTWRLETPLTVGNMPAVLLPDHRLEYLTYEGPISGNRGNVRRVAEGTYTQLAGPLNQYVLSGTNNGPASREIPVPITGTART